MKKLFLILFLLPIFCFSQTKTTISALQKRVTAKEGVIYETFTSKNKVKTYRYWTKLVGNASGRATIKAARGLVFVEVQKGVSLNAEVTFDIGNETTVYLREANGHYLRLEYSKRRHIKIGTEGSDMLTIAANKQEVPDGPWKYQQSFAKYDVVKTVTFGVKDLEVYLKLDGKEEIRFVNLELVQEGKVRVEGDAANVKTVVLKSEMRSDFKAGILDPTDKGIELQADMFAFFKGEAGNNYIDLIEGDMSRFKVGDPLILETGGEDAVTVTDYNYSDYFKTAKGTKTIAAGYRGNANGVGGSFPENAVGTMAEAWKCTRFPAGELFRVVESGIVFRVDAPGVCWPAEFREVNGHGKEREWNWQYSRALAKALRANISRIEGNRIYLDKTLQASTKKTRVCYDATATLNVLANPADQDMYATWHRSNQAIRGGSRARVNNWKIKLKADGRYFVSDMWEMGHVQNTTIESEGEEKAIIETPMGVPMMFTSMQFAVNSGYRNIHFISNYKEQGFGLEYWRAGKSEIAINKPFYNATLMNISQCKNIILENIKMSYPVITFIGIGNSDGGLIKNLDCKLAIDPMFYSWGFVFNQGCKNVLVDGYSYESPVLTGAIENFNDAGGNEVRNYRFINGGAATNSGVTGLIFRNGRITITPNSNANDRPVNHDIFFIGENSGYNKGTSGGGIYGLEIEIQGEHDKFGNIGLTGVNVYGVPNFTIEDYKFKSPAKKPGATWGGRALSVEASGFVGKRIYVDAPNESGAVDLNVGYVEDVTLAKGTHMNVNSKKVSWKNVKGAIYDHAAGGLIQE